MTTGVPAVIMNPIKAKTRLWAGLCLRAGPPDTSEHYVYTLSYSTLSSTNFITNGITASLTAGFIAVS